MQLSPQPLGPREAGVRGSEGPGEGRGHCPGRQLCSLLVTPVRGHSGPSPQSINTVSVRCHQGARLSRYRNTKSSSDSWHVLPAPQAAGSAAAAPWPLAVTRRPWRSAHCTEKPHALCTPGLEAAFPHSGGLRPHRQTLQAHREPASTCPDASSLDGAPEEGGGVVRGCHALLIAR